MVIEGLVCSFHFCGVFLKRKLVFILVRALIELLLAPAASLAGFPITLIVVPQSDDCPTSILSSFEGAHPLPSVSVFAERLDFAIDRSIIRGPIWASL
jgi:hypothetical protein